LKLFIIYTLEMLVGPFESEVHTHSSCCWEPLWKQRTYTLNLILRTPLKAEQALLTHYSCYWRPVRKQSTSTLHLLLGALLKAE